MQPYVHAQASAGRQGRDWEEDLPIHEFMDLAKHACPDLRHRLILHNADLGPELVARAFPDRQDAQDVALLHVGQDLGWTPTLADWLAHCDPDRLPAARNGGPTAQDIIRSAVAHHDLADPEPIQRVWDLLTLPARLAPQHGQCARALLMSSLGPILARAVLGQPKAFSRCDGGTAIVDFGWVAEGMVVAAVGSIHSLERILRCSDGREPARAHPVGG